MELIGTIKAKGALTGSFDFDQADYNLLKNKPSINGVELVGNKTSEDLHIETGGGGTTDYNDLTNKPMINGIGLIDNKTANDLGLQEEIDFPQDPTKYLDGEGNFTTPPTVGSYNDLMDKPQINGVTLTGNKTGDDLDLSNKAHFTELSGSIVSFQDGQELPLAKCVVDINPTQDLHGYDNPWDGGAGKNKFIVPTLAELQTLNTSGTWNNEEYTTNGITFKCNFGEDGLLTTIEESGTATGQAEMWLKAFSGLDGNYYFSGGIDNNKYITFQKNGSWSGTYIKNVDVAVTLDSTDTIRPIIAIGSGQTGTATFMPMIRLSSIADNTFEPYSNICPISGHSSVTINVSPTADPSQGIDIIIQLGNAYYGGKLNVTTGELYIDRQIIDLGTLSWTRTDNTIIDVGYWFYTNITGKVTSRKTINSNYRTSQYASIAQLVQNEGSGVDFVAIEAGGDTQYRIIDSRYYLASDFETAMNGVQMCYYLSAPQTIQLTTQKVKSLLEQNYIEADTGDIDIIYINNVNDPAIEFILNNL